MKPLFCAAVLLGSLGAAVNVANADPVLWTLSTLDFNGGTGFAIADGGIASGFFTSDADTTTYSDWNIDISGFGAGFNQANALVTPANSFIEFVTPQSFVLSYSSDQALISLFFVAPLTNAGGTVQVFANVIDNGDPFFSWQAQGTVSGGVPEPASAVLLLAGIGFCLLSLSLHQHRFGRNGASAKNARE